ncbi:MAG: porin family protein [Bacteroidota bacterium]
MKQYLLIIILFLLANSIYAQAKLEAGIKGGLNLATLSSDIGATFESKTGYHLGAFAMIKAANVGLQTELLFSAQGSNYSYSSINQRLYADFTYLILPFLFKYYLPAGLNLQVGPQFGYLMSAKGIYATKNGSQVNISPGIQDLSDQYKNSDISAAFGAGWDSPFGFNIVLRYLLGLNNISLTDSEWKNRVFQVAVGFRLFEMGR